MAKETAKPTPESEYHIEDAAKKSKINFKALSKTRNFRIVASVVGGAIALGASFGLGVVTGKATGGDDRNFSQFGGPGMGQFGGPNGQRPNRDDMDPGNHDDMNMQQWGKLPGNAATTSTGSGQNN